MGMTWILIDLYSSQMLPVPANSQTDLVDPNYVADVFHKITGQKVKEYEQVVGGGETSHFSVEIKLL